jgi:hypothetical protein
VSALAKLTGSNKPTYINLVMRDGEQTVPCGWAFLLTDGRVAWTDVGFWNDYSGHGMHLIQGVIDGQTVLSTDPEAFILEAEFEEALPFDPLYVIWQDHDAAAKRDGYDRDKARSSLAQFFRLSTADFLN